ncbi:MFS transporter [Catellatospora chokoriensis]|uniref:MFS transporter n=1 Tax=Catellatospora chokoriensis TaxID=310353 RepID=A0A8J3K5X9_9ACTN|nr:MFS transporter [Catellatospora chokoriensis]GIF89154.1 MFS transporter [Catellatospora chokoriensis]
MTVQQLDSSEATQSPRGLRLLLASAAVSVTGDGALLAAAPLMAASLSQDPFEIGLVAAAGYAAWIVAGLPAGALVDRWNRRTVMVAADAFRALTLGLFALLVVTGHASIAALVATVFLVGLGSCFFDPAVQSLIPDLVGRDKALLTRANGALWGIDTLGRSLTGPPLGAASFALARALPFAADALSFIGSAVLLRFIPSAPSHNAVHPRLLASVRAGMAFLATHGELRRLTLGMGAYNLGWNLGFATLVLYAQQFLNLGAMGYGILISAGAVGGALSGWLTPKLVKSASASGVYAVALVLQAAIWLTVASTGNPWVAGTAIMFLGGLSTTVSTVGGTARQLLTPGDLVGRVVSATRLVGIGAAAAGAFLGGVISQQEGLRAPMLTSAGLLVLIAAVFLVAHRQSSR